jgi:hypothetical protein
MDEVSREVVKAREVKMKVLSIFIIKTIKKIDHKYLIRLVHYPKQIIIELGV